MCVISVLSTPESFLGAKNRYNGFKQVGGSVLFSFRYKSQSLPHSRKTSTYIQFDQTRQPIDSNVTETPRHIKTPQEENIPYQTQSKTDYSFIMAKTVIKKACSTEGCTWTPDQGQDCPKHPKTDQKPASKAPIAANKTKRMTHHCPKAAKGNCRRAKHPTLGHGYCSKHQYYCSVELCTYTPIQGQPCLKHGDPEQRIASRR